MAFVTVSSAVGFSHKRENNIQSLPIAPRMKGHLINFRRDILLEGMGGWWWYHFHINEPSVYLNGDDYTLLKIIDYFNLQLRHILKLKPLLLQPSHHVLKKVRRRNLTMWSDSWRYYEFLCLCYLTNHNVAVAASILILF